MFTRYTGPGRTNSRDLYVLSGRMAGKTYIAGYGSLPQPVIFLQVHMQERNLSIAVSGTQRTSVKGGRSIECIAMVFPYQTLEILFDMINQLYLQMDTTMGFFTQSITVLQSLLIAIGAGLGLWGLVNLLEGYGSDNPASKSQGIKQLMAGAGIMLIATILVPLLSNVFPAGGGGGTVWNDTIRVAFSTRPSIWPIAAHASGDAVSFTVVPQEALTASLAEAAHAAEGISFSLHVLPEVSSILCRAAFPQASAVMTTFMQISAI